jgi:glycosyltransferase involved in cell wall biosynthesis
MLIQKRSLLIEGWRGINHSYSMVNQYQLKEILKYKFDLYHLDVPFFNSHWNARINSDGLDSNSKQLISSIPVSSKFDYDKKINTTYRISFPFNFSNSNSEKLFIFGTSEFQNIEGMVANDLLKTGIENITLKIITPSNWSKVGFLNAGFRDDRIHVIPHGVDLDIFKPANLSRKKEFRKALGVEDDDFLILSVGAMTENKGVDILIRAFLQLAKKYNHVKLVLKDQSKLYGIFAKNLLKTYATEQSIFLDEKILARVICLSDNLTLAQLSGLYSSADCYVSAYRAEGFNLTPLEAAACGTPIVITSGGATDDYFNDSFAVPLDGKKISLGLKTFIEPSLDDLIEKLSNLVEGKKFRLNSIAAVDFISNNFSWHSVTKKLVSLF